MADDSVTAFAKTKVEHLDDTLWGHLDVRRFQIAMNDAAVVRGFQCFGHLSRDRHRLVDRHGTGRQSFGQRRAVDELEDERRDVPTFLESVDGPDVWMIERRKGERLVFETRPTVRVSRHGIGQHLDRDRAPQLGVLRAIDLAHSARPSRRSMRNGPS